MVCADDAQFKIVCCHSKYPKRRELVVFVGVELSRVISGRIGYIHPLNHLSHAHKILAVLQTLDDLKMDNLDV